jgi:hypothetical protein
MSAATRLKLTTIAEVVFAIELVVAIVLGAPTWAIVVLGVLLADTVAYGLWQLRAREVSRSVSA